MEPNQVHVVALSVSGDLQQLIHALESRFSGEVVCDVVKRLGPALDGSFETSATPLALPVTGLANEVEPGPERKATRSGLRSPTV